MYQNEITPYLEHYLTTIKNPKLSAILKYSVEGGKCVRGFIVKHIIETLGENNIVIWEAVTCIELIHAASLIIDDLPCMDNDKVRRGKLSTFAKFGKHEAILLALYMISESVKLITNSLPKNTLERSQILLNQWCDLLGNNLIIGQLLDLKSEIADYFQINTNTDNYNLLIIKYKTCSLFSFAFIIGAIFTGKECDIEDFKEMGLHFGMLFQLVDDYKDMHEDDTMINYVLKYGIAKTFMEYSKSKTQLIMLLKKYNLYTTKFKSLISHLDSCFPAAPSTNSNIVLSN